MLALDGSVSPYLPTREMMAALQAGVEPERSPAVLARMLRERLGGLFGVSTARIALFPHDEQRLDRLRDLTANDVWCVFPPGSSALGHGAVQSRLLAIERSDRFRIEAEQIGATPRGSVALVMTPNDPIGNAISVTVAAQLARRAGLLVLDERSAELQRRSMIPLVEELDSIVLLRSFSDWAGLGANAPGYAITSSRIATVIDRSHELEAPGLHAALAAVSHAAQLDAVAQRVRIERLRLYRMLRKLNFLAPYPSDAGYVLAQVTRGDRDQIARALAQREIAVYAPSQDRLQHTLRFSAISPVATSTLQCALVDVSRSVLDAPARTQGVFTN